MISGILLFIGGALANNAALSSLYPPSFQPDASELFFPRASELTGSNDEALDFWMRNQGPWRHEHAWMQPEDLQAWGVSWYHLGYQVGLHGRAMEWPHAWSAATGMDFLPGWQGGLTVGHETRLPWREGLAIGADTRVQVGRRLGLSLSSPPRPWSQAFLEHRWGVEIHPLVGPDFFSRGWVGLEWPWIDDNPHAPRLLLHGQGPRSLSVNLGYDLGRREWRGTLAAALRPRFWINAGTDKKGGQFYRAQWRRNPYAQPLLQNRETAVIEWNQTWVEGETEKNVFGSTQAIGFPDILAGLKILATRSEIRRVVFVVRGLRADLPMAQEAGRLLDSLRAAGTQVDFYLDQVTPLGLFLGSHGNRIAVHPQGYFGVRGFHTETLFYGGFFQKIGVTPQFLKHGRYKTFAEPFMNDSASTEFVDNTREWLGDMQTVFREEIARNRKIPPASLQAFLARGELSLDSAKAAGLIDTLANEYDFVHPKGGQNRISRLTFPLDPIYAAVPVEAPRIAVLYLSGPIVDDGSNAFPLFAERGFSPNQVLPILRAVERDPAIRALVIRMDSPGGSAQASDIIAEGLGRFRASGKPVVLSVGGMAASGGYYIATEADKIVAEPTSIIGSIGVVWGKASGEKLLEKLGLRAETIKTEPHADAMSVYRTWTDEELAIIQKHLDEFYGHFVQRVGRSRKLDSLRLDSIAEGRVFTGSRALTNGLIDGLGGLDHALALAGDLAGLEKNIPVQAEPHDVKTKGWAGLLAGNTRFEPMDAVDRWREWWTALSKMQSSPRIWAIAPYDRAGPDR